MHLSDKLHSEQGLLIHRLSNGLTCWLLPVEISSETNLEMRLVIRCGFLNERAGEYGSAHLLEHLAFCGSRHFPDNSLLPFLESMGMRVGRDINGWTGPTETTFALSWGHEQADAREVGLRVLWDIARGLTLSPDQISREKHVVREEMRLSRSGSSPLNRKMLEAMFPHVSGFKRDPLGDPLTLENIDREALHSFYHTWYRPGNALLFVVGDLDLSVWKQRIEDAFGGWEPTEGCPRHNGFIPARSPGGPRVCIRNDEALTEARADLFSFEPTRPMVREPDFRKRLTGELALKFVDMHLTEKSLGPSPSLKSAHAVLREIYHAGFQFRASASLGASHMEAALQVFLRGIRQIRELGPSHGELEIAKRACLMEMEQRYTPSPPQEAKLLMQEMIRAAMTDSTFLCPSRALEMIRRSMPEITRRELIEALQSAFAVDKQTLLLSVPSPWRKRAVVSAEDTLDLLHRIETERVVASSNLPVHARFEYPSGKGGKVAESEAEPGLDILSVTFENGVRLHLRAMNELKDRVLIRILLQGGRINEDMSRRGLTDAAVIPFYRPATRRHNSREIYRFMQDNRITVDAKVLEDGVQVAVLCPSDRFKPGCLLAHALLTEPDIEEEMLSRWREGMMENIPGDADRMDRLLHNLFRKTISGEDPRFSPLTREQVSAVDRQKARTWLERMIRHAPMEMSIVGHQNRSTLLKAAEEYFGTLTSRPRRDISLEDRRCLSPMKGPVIRAITRPGKRVGSRIFMGWRAPPWHAVQERRMFHLAATMLNSRLKRVLRQEAGRLYDLYCTMHASKAYPTISWIGTSFTTDPDDAELVAGEARRTMEAFAAEGPDPAELERAGCQMIEKVRRTQAKAAYWSHILSELDYHHKGLEPIRNVDEAYGAFTRKGITRVMQRYFIESNRWQFTGHEIGSPLS